MIRQHRLEEVPVLWGIVTDASPFGLGGVLIHRDRVDRDFTALAAFEAKFTKEEAEMFGVTHGDSSSQAFVECLAVYRAIVHWAAKFRGHKLLIKSDSTVALGMAQKLASPNASLNWLASELSLQLELGDVDSLVPQHIAGIYNVEADFLSRWHERPAQVLPKTLAKLKVRSLQPLTVESFSLAPPGGEGSNLSNSIAAWSAVRWWEGRRKEKTADRPGEFMGWCWETLSFVSGRFCVVFSPPSSLPVPLPVRCDSWIPCLQLSSHQHSKWHAAMNPAVIDYTPWGGGAKEPEIQLPAVEPDVSSPMGFPGSHMDDRVGKRLVLQAMVSGGGQPSRPCQRVKELARQVWAKITIPTQLGMDGKHCRGRC